MVCRYYRIKPSGALGISFQNCPKALRKFLLPERFHKLIEIDMKAAAPTILWNLARFLGLERARLDCARRRVTPFGANRKKDVLYAIHANFMRLDCADDLKELHEEVCLIFNELRAPLAPLFSQCNDTQGSKIAAVASRMEAIIVSAVVRFVKEVLPSHGKVLGAAGDAIFVGLEHNLPWDEVELSVRLRDFVLEVTRGFDVSSMFTETPCGHHGPGLDVSFHVDILHERNDLLPIAPMTLSGEENRLPTQPNGNVPEPYYVSGIGATLSVTGNAYDDIDNVPHLRDFVEHIGDTNLIRWQMIAQYYCKLGDHLVIEFPPEGKGRSVNMQQAETILTETALILNHCGLRYLDKDGMLYSCLDHGDVNVYFVRDIVVEDEICARKRLVERASSQIEFVEWLCKKLIPWPSLLSCFRFNENTVVLSRLAAKICGTDAMQSSYLGLPRINFLKSLCLATPSGIIHFEKGRDVGLPFVPWEKDTTNAHFRNVIYMEPGDIEGLQSLMKKKITLRDIVEATNGTVLEALYPLIAIMMVNKGDDTVFPPDAIPKLDPDVLDAVGYVLQLMGFALGVVADFPVFVYFYGCAGAGKTMLMSVVQNFLGDDLVHYINAADNSKHAMNIGVRRGHTVELCRTLVNNDVQRELSPSTAEKLLDMLDPKARNKITVEPKGLPHMSIERPRDRHIVGIACGNKSPVSLVTGTPSAWMRRVLPAAFVVPLESKIPVDLVKYLQDYSDTIIFLATALAKNHVDFSPSEKPEPPKVLFIVHDFTNISIPLTSLYVACIVNTIIYDVLG